MKIYKCLSVVLLALAAYTSNAQSDNGAAFVGNDVSTSNFDASETKSFYLYNVKTKRFLTNGGSTGLLPVLNDVGSLLGVRMSPHKTEFTISTGVTNTYEYLVYTDAGTLICNGGSGAPDGQKWHFDAVSGLTNVYVLYSDENTGMYLASQSGSDELVMTADNTSEYAQWMFVSYDDRLGRVDESIGVFASVDASFLVSNPDFTVYRDNSAWQGTATAVGGNIDNQAVEMFSTTYDYYQELTGVPNGVYKLSAQALYRYGDVSRAGTTDYRGLLDCEAADIRSTGNEKSLALLYANVNTSAIESIFEDAGLNGSVGENTIFGYVPNSLATTSSYFSANLYADNSVLVTVTDGTLRIGVKKTEGKTYDWTAFDAFRLTYYGNTATAASMVDPYNEYQALRITVKKLMTYPASNDNSSALSSLAGVLAVQDNAVLIATDNTAINSAITALTDAAYDYIDESQPMPFYEYSVLKQQVNNLKSVSYDPDETSASEKSAAETALNSVIASADAVVLNTLYVADVEEQMALIRTAAIEYLVAVPPADGNYYDVTCLVKNNSFNKINVDDRYDFVYNGGLIEEWDLLNTSIHTNNHFQVAEAYVGDTNEFGFSQTISGLPKGSYHLTANAFQRPGSPQEAYDDYSAGTNNVTTYLYVNDAQKKIKHIMSELRNTPYFSVSDSATVSSELGYDFNYGRWIMADSEIQTADGVAYVPNSMYGSNLYFNSDCYNNEVYTTIDTGDDLTIGLYGTAVKDYDWSIFDNFRLLYYGDNSNNAELLERLDKLKKFIDDAEILYDTKYVEVVSGSHSTFRTAIDACIAAYEDAKTYAKESSDITGANSMIDAAQDALRVAVWNYVRDADPAPSARFDLTFTMHLPETYPDVTSLAAGDNTTSTGWTTDIAGGNFRAWTSSGSTNAEYYEKWTASTFPDDTYALYQTIALPDGSYKIEAQTLSNGNAVLSAGDSGDDGSAISGITLADNDYTFSVDDDANEFTDTKLGIKTVTGNTANWVGINDLKIYEVPVVIIDEDLAYSPDDDSDYYFNIHADAVVSVHRTLSTGKFVTMVLPFDMTADEFESVWGESHRWEFSYSDIQLYGDNGADGAVVGMYFTSFSDIEANVPFLMMLDDAFTVPSDNIYPLPNEVDVAKFTNAPVVTEEVDDARSTETGYFSFYGNYDGAANGGSGFALPATAYYISSNKFKYVPAGVTQCMKGLRGYFMYTEPTYGEVKEMKVNISLDGQTTAIEDIFSNISTADSGCSPIYNMKGQRVSVADAKSHPGIYIKSGKKVMIK